MLMQLVAAMMLASGLTATPAGPTDVAEEFHARIVWLGFNDSFVGSGTVRIVIQRWSTDSEREVLLAAMKSGRPEAMWAALTGLKPQIGRLIYGAPRLLGSDGAPASPTDLGYAVDSRRADGTRQVKIILVEGVPSRGYQPSLDWIELVIKADGSGEGVETFGCQLGVNRAGGDIELKAAGPRKARITILKQ
jgi:hypothetical protein